MPEKTIAYGNKRSKIIHSTRRGDSCRASEIAEKNLVRFENARAVDDAISEGWRKCLACNKTVIE